MLFLVMVFITILCVSAQRPEKDISILFCHCLPYSLERGSLTEPGAMLVGNSSNPPVSTLHSTGVTDTSIHGLM